MADDKNSQERLAEQQAARGTAAGLTKLQDRNMVATGVAGLAQAQADQANKLAAMDADARERTLNDMVEVALAALSKN